MSRNNKLIIQKIEELKKICCSQCKNPVDGEMCIFCKVYILVGEILNLLNGGK